MAQRIAANAECSVLVVREGKEGEHGFRRAVIASDFSDQSARAVDLARAVVCPEATLDLIHCWRVPDSRVIGSSDSETLDDKDALARQVHAQIERAGREWLAEQMGPGDVIRFDLVPQRPVPGILDWIDSHGNDLLVVGSTGCEGARKASLGSVASSVLERASCSVLVVR